MRLLRLEEAKSRETVIWGLRLNVELRLETKTSGNYEISLESICICYSTTWRVQMKRAVTMKNISAKFERPNCIIVDYVVIITDRRTSCSTFYGGGYTNFTSKFGCRITAFLLKRIHYQLSAFPPTKKAKFYGLLKIILVYKFCSVISNRVKFTELFL